ncbi:MAG: rhodanese-like domain-containing protein [bacterium]
MYVEQFYETGLSHSSYLLGGENQCAIIDPQRDTEKYIKAAKAMGMKITHIIETHLHADFISGHMDLAEKTGADIYAPKSARCKYKHIALKEGDSFKIEHVKLDVLETPGHTPEHISYVVTDTSRGKSPACLFCGDTLFVGDVGRPDLFPGRAEELAGKLFNSLKKLKKLPAHVEVFPAHGAGSLCGRAMGAKRRSTIGYEKKYNEPFKMKSKKQLITSLTTNMPPAPDHFSRCSEINRKGPKKLSKMKPLEKIAPAEFHKKSGSPGTVVLDGRDYDAFGGQHVPGSYHIDCGGKFSTFSGWVIPPNKKILLVAGSKEQAETMALKLRRVGLDNIEGFLNGSLFEWSKNGLEAGHLRVVSASEAYNMMNGKDSIVFVDVRAPDEFEDMHIKGTVNIPAPDLRTDYKKLSKKDTILLSCTTGHRSSLGASILMQKGFENLFNVAGGINGLNELGKNLKCKSCKK